MMKNSLLFLISFFAISSCNFSSIKEKMNGNAIKSTKFKPVSSKSSFTMMIPNYMDSVSKLHNEAALQYANIFKELYLIVIEEDIATLESSIEDGLLEDYFSDSLPLLKNYTAFMLKGMKESDDFTIHDSLTTSINNVVATKCSVSATVDNIKIFYKVAAVKSKEKIYQVFSWTTVSNKEKYGQVLDSMINSFRVL